MQQTGTSRSVTQTETAREKSPVLCIVGPTATGKSELAVLVAREVGGEVISADSMQVYRGMDIGTAKLTPEEMQGVPHHLINVVDPDQPFTVADWKRAAERVVARLHAAGVLPVVVGGTGLYIKALVDDLDFGGATGSPGIREKWRRFYQDHGAEALFLQLRRLDPGSAARLHPHDVKRVIRALEVAETGPEPLSAGYDWHPRNGRYQVLQWALDVPRPRLYARVNARVDQMMAAGLYNEVAGLLAKGYGRHLPAMQAIGYKELAACLAGEITLSAAVEQIKRATRRFVKRQLSWFRRDPRVIWLPRENPDAPWPDELLAAVFAQAQAWAAGISHTRRE
ncbi:MAG: tRNA (adenosine(37)-N6)-dimethylallyltransferase MiaA [Alicyclobacillus sp.]|nr:tRNA (adenosine(37)-N6)-dimethylallyltransferase MiaA [Alicyclobacillus sp.]